MNGIVAHARLQQVERDQAGKARQVVVGDDRVPRLVERFEERDLGIDAARLRVQAAAREVRQRAARGRAPNPRDGGREKTRSRGCAGISRAVCRRATPRPPIGASCAPRRMTNRTPRGRRGDSSSWSHAAPPATDGDKRRQSHGGQGEADRFRHGAHRKELNLEAATACAQVERIADRGEDGASRRSPCWRWRNSRSRTACSRRDRPRRKRSSSSTGSNLKPKEPSGSSKRESAPRASSLGSARNTPTIGARRRMHAVVEDDRVIHAAVCVGELGGQPDVDGSRSIQVRIGAGGEGIADAEEPEGRSRDDDRPGRRLRHGRVVGQGLRPRPRCKVAVRWQRSSGSGVRSRRRRTRRRPSPPRTRIRSSGCWARLGKGRPSLTSACAA